jgi:predicted Zn-dependent protease
MGPFGDSSAGLGQRRGGVHWGVLILAALYMGYYYFSHQQAVPVTHRKQLVDISPQQEAQLGFQSYQEVLHESKVVQGGAQVQAVRDIGQRIVEAARKLAPDAHWDTYQWEFNLIQSDQANAFCLPGGKVAVYTGILPIVKNTDALAVVMGHEIAHAIARHGAERMAQQKLVQIGTVAAGMSTSDMDPRQQQMVMAALGAGLQYGVMLPFSRQHESEADHMGLLFAAAACFDPREAPKLWERMDSNGGQRPPEFASTHPSGQTRIQQLNAWMPEAVQAYEQNCGKRLAGP